jgi:hypothetical protein
MLRRMPIGLVLIAGVSVAADEPDEKAKEAARVKALAARTVVDPSYRPEVGDTAALVSTAPGPGSRPAPTVCGMSPVDYCEYLKYAWFVEREAVEAIKRREVQKLKDDGRIVELGYGTEVLVTEASASVTVNDKPPRTLKILEVRPVDGPHRDKALYVTEPHVARLIPAPAPSADARAATLLRSAQNLEKAGKAAGASAMYRQVVKDFPGTPQARSAAERLKALGGK